MKKFSVKLLSLTLAIASVMSIGLLTAKPALRADTEEEIVLEDEELDLGGEEIELEEIDEASLQGLDEKIKKVTDIAKAENKYHEKKSANKKYINTKNKNNGNKNYTKYAKYFDGQRKNYKFYNGKKQGIAWCDVFVDWCFAQAFGIKTASKVLYQKKNSCGASANWSMKYYKNNKAFSKTPKEGDQIFFSKKANGSKAVHTGIVVKVDKDTKKITVVEGNKNNQVKITKYTYTGKGKNKKIIGYGHPNYAAVK